MSCSFCTWTCSATAFRLAHGYHECAQAGHLHKQGPNHYAAIVIEISGDMQVLDSNAANLCPKYKDDCKHAWGIKNSLFGVSSVVPAQRMSDCFGDPSKAGADFV